MTIETLVEVEPVEEKMTLDEFTGIAWEKSHTILEQAQTTLQETSRRYDPEIRDHAKVLAVLYGRNPEIPQYTIGIHYMPVLNTSKGEPVTNFADVPAITNMADILMWTNGYKEGKGESPEQTVVIMMHEIQHFSYQRAGLKDDNIIKLIQDINPDIQGLEDTLMKDKNVTFFHYGNPTMELVTAYLEADLRRKISNKKPTEDTTTSAQPPLLNFKADKEDCALLLKEVMDRDTIDRQRHQEGGAYTKLLEGWKNLLEKGAPQEPNSRPKNPESHRPKYNVYTLARSLPPNLIDAYYDQGKQIDGEFIRKLYEMAMEKLKKEE